MSLTTSLMPRVKLVNIIIFFFFSNIHFTNVHYFIICLEIEGFIKSPLACGHVVDMGICVLGFSNNFKIQVEIRAFNIEKAPSFSRGQHVIVQGEIIRRSMFLFFEPDFIFKFFSMSVDINCNFRYLNICFRWYSCYQIS